MYLPGDPLFALDPIYQSILDPAARSRLVATYDHDVTTHEWATGYTWDIVPRTDPGQTVGPFFGYALPFDGGADLVSSSHPRAIRLHGTLYDGVGDPIPDALLELWQADEDGHVPQVEGSRARDGWVFTGFRRTPVDATGHYSFTTLRPGATEPGRPTFFAMTVFARGLLHRLLTRAYLPLDDQAAASDPLLGSLPPDRRATLVTRPDNDGFVFDIRLQGPGETVFLDFWDG